jgi:hypothetical protein
MTPEKINIVISPEVLSSDIVQEIYGSNAFGVYENLPYILSGGTGGTSLLTGLTIPILLTQKINDIGYYSPFEGFLDQIDTVTNFIYSGNPINPYNVKVFNSSSYNSASFLNISTYKINWGDGNETATLSTLNNLQEHTYNTVSQTYTITLTQTNTWGITEVKKTVSIPFTGVTIDNQLGNITFNQLGGNWSATPLSYNYIFTGDSNNNINQQVSSYYTTVPFLVSGYTLSNLNQLRRYGPQPYTVGYIQNLGNGSIGYVNEINNTYTAYTINNVLYYDFTNGKTLFLIDSSGFTSNDIVVSGLTKDEYLLDFVMDPEIQTDILLERGRYSAFESLIRLGEVDNIGDLERYGYGFFRINTT